MSIAQAVATILDEKGTLDIESIDRMYLNVYIPHRQTPAGGAPFFRGHRGATFASSALMAPMTTAFVAALERYARTQGVPLLAVPKGQRKDEVAAEPLAQCHAEEGVLVIGKAQEKAPVCRTEQRRNPQTGRPYPWRVRSTALVNQYYIYAVDRDCTTSTRWIGTAGRSFSSSARTSPTPPSCASMGTSISSAH